MMRLATRRVLQQQALQLRAPLQAQQLLFSTCRSSSARRKQQQQLTRSLLAAEFTKHNVRHDELMKHNAAVLANLATMREQAAQHTAQMKSSLNHIYWMVFCCVMTITFK
jgi:hypothetical protein